MESDFFLSFLFFGRWFPPIVEKNGKWFCFYLFLFFERWFPLLVEKNGKWFLKNFFYFLKGDSHSYARFSSIILALLGSDYPSYTRRRRDSKVTSPWVCLSAPIPPSSERIGMQGYFDSIKNRSWRVWNEPSESNLDQQIGWYRL